MPNPRWNNMHGPNDKSGGGHKEGARGSAPSGGVTYKTANWPGLPGATQSKDRSAGVKKTGHKGPFHYVAKGL